MWARTEQVCSRWRPGQRLDVLGEMRRVALLILADCLFGVDLTPDLHPLWPHILRTLKYISPGPWILWPGLPRPGYTRSRREVDRYLYGLVRERRASGPVGDDMLSLLVSEPGLSDRLVRDQLLTMLIAGHDTVTAHLAWAVHLLGVNRSVARRARQEVDRTLAGSPGPPPVAQLESLTYLGQVVNEALRLYPPIHVGNRRAAEEVRFGGWRIPPGSRVIYSIYLAHRDPRHWACPHRFDPDRFSPDCLRKIEP
jgi:cytochrome P450